MHMLLTRIRQAHVYLPLALFFMANAIIESVSLMTVTEVIRDYPFWPRFLAVGSSPLHLVLAPLFWVYVRAITADHHTLWRSNDYRHFLPALFSIGIPLGTIYLGQSEFLGLFDKPRPHTSDAQRTLIWAVNILDGIVIVQVTFYIAMILRRLAQHKKSLAQLFASTEHLELRWVRWLTVFLVIYTVVSAISSLTKSYLLLEPWESIIDVALLWFLVIWGLRQKPGLANELAATKLANLNPDTQGSVELDSNGNGKYEHSALSQDQLRAIAAKISSCMEQEALYRDPELSLRALSAHINELPNYVSQALNREIGESFFDYINGWRIVDAKQQLNDPNLTVLAIAEKVGFNSRSSFYNAFKKNTGLTPSAFKKTLAQSA